jgi:hypothetical protein
VIPESTLLRISQIQYLLHLNSETDIHSSSKVFARQRIQNERQRRRCTTDKTIIPTLFLKKQVEGEWVSDPWDARLVNEFGRKVLLDERTLWPSDGKFVTASILARTDYLQQNPDLIKKLVAANVSKSYGLIIIQI